MKIKYLLRAEQCLYIKPCKSLKEVKETIKENVTTNKWVLYKQVDL